MWVFGYGSLMWDRWEATFGCDRKEIAALDGYRRDFNKASVRNWGTKETPGPTLGLEPSAGERCVGLAFEIPDSNEDAALTELRRRESSDFVLEKREVQLASGASVLAVIAVNDRSKRTYMGGLSLSRRTRLATDAVGTSGSCRVYVEQIAKQLAALGIDDRAVSEFSTLVAERIRLANDRISD